MNSPKVETRGKVLLDQGNTGFRKALYVRDSSFLGLNPSGPIVKGNLIVVEGKKVVYWF
jgi:hypothetical protein